MEPKCYTKEDIVINLRDMVWHILRHWRSIVAGVVVFTLLATGYKYWQDYRVYRNPPTPSTQSRVELSQEDQASVNIALNYQQAYEVQAEHNAYAPVMKIDPSRVSVTVFSGVITGEKSYAAAQLYSQMLKAGTACAEIAESLQWKEASYVEDLVEMDVLTTSNHPDNTDGGVMLHVRCYAPTEKESRAIASYLRRRLPTLTAAVEQAAGVHTLRTTDTEYRVEVNDRFRDIQQGYINDYNLVVSNLETVMKDLSAAGKTYIKELKTGVQETPSSVPAVARPTVNSKYAVVGFGGGLILLVALYMVTYLIDKHVKSAEDMTLRYGVSVLGCLPQEGGKRRRFDRRLKAVLFARDKGRPAAQREEWLLHQVVLTARKAGVGSLYVTGSGLSPEDSERLAKLAQAASAEDVALHVGPCPLYDTVGMDALAAADAVLLVEKAEVSTYAAVEQELALSERLQVPVLGAILLS